MSDTPLLDAIILAAGHNTRLRGIVPTAYKPLLVMNGETLVGRLVRQSIEVANAASVVTVVSPMNSQPIAEVVGQRSFLMLQSLPTGPLDALRLAMRLCMQDNVLVLCGDNYVPDRDFADVAVSAARGQLRVATRRLPVGQARRFTTVLDGHFQGPREVSDCGATDCWIGPILAPRVALLDALEEHDEIGDQFADVFNWMVKYRNVRAMPCATECSDLGIPDELRA